MSCQGMCFRVSESGQHYRVVEYYANRTKKLAPRIFPSVEAARVWVSVYIGIPNPITYSIVRVDLGHSFVVSRDGTLTEIFDELGEPTRLAILADFPPDYEDLRTKFWECERQREERAWQRAKLLCGFGVNYLGCLEPKRRAA